MSTYLSLVQDLHSEVGAAGTAPQAVTGLSGEAQRLAGWIKQADNLIQLKYVNWKFLTNEFSTSNVTTQSVATLAKPVGLRYWDYKTLPLLSRPARRDIRSVRLSMTRSNEKFWTRPRDLSIVSSS